MATFKHAQPQSISFEKELHAVLDGHVLIVAPVNGGEITKIEAQLGSAPARIKRKALISPECRKSLLQPSDIDEASNKRRKTTLRATKDGKRVVSRTPHSGMLPQESATPSAMQASSTRQRRPEGTIARRQMATRERYKALGRRKSERLVNKAEGGPDASENTAPLSSTESRAKASPATRAGVNTSSSGTASSSYSAASGRRASGGTVSPEAQAGAGTDEQRLTALKKGEWKATLEPGAHRVAVPTTPLSSANGPTPTVVLSSARILSHALTNGWTPGRVTASADVLEVWEDVQVWNALS
ncbi:hypothetical protein FA95DRAFT_1558165 [Auriscalpium vulgare]|uniref:Uncharacterized protein n=1 Tax=Auriscalpium vulgare TaxID=40419 RepID=A0ACB8RWI8_9AGAM|nr:hypothetical protein FA95DRAFT_1558165 [Auriscalpium vulgare]